MKRITVREAFGGEVAFTQWLSKDRAAQGRLLLALDLDPELGWNLEPEDPTQDGKRVDITVRDSEGTACLVVESQDTGGWLDSVHATKILYYMWDKGVDQGALLCEDADERIMNFVRGLNQDHGHQIWLVRTLCYQLADQGGVFVDFVPLIRSANSDSTQTRRVAREPDPDQERRLRAIADSNPGVFTNITGRYLSRVRLGPDQMNVGLVPYKNGRYWVDIWHGGRANTELFRETYQESCGKQGLTARFQQARAYVNGDGGFPEDLAVKWFLHFVQELETGAIRAHDRE